MNEFLLNFYFSEKILEKILKSNGNLILGSRNKISTNKIKKDKTFCLKFRVL